MAFPFLNLPPELRLAVYDEILHPAEFRNDLGDGHTCYDFDLSLFYVNKQIYHEARKVYLRNFTFVRADTPWTEASHHLQTSGRVPILATGAQANAFKGQSLDLTIKGPGVVRDFDQDDNMLLLLADDLPLFCQMWFYYNLSFEGELNRHMTVTLKLNNPFGETSDEELPRAIQRQLMQPFGMVKRLGAVTVEGQHSEEIEKAMRAEMEEPEESPEKCLEDATKLEEAGKLALKKGNPKLAVDLFLQSFKAMHIVCIGHYRGIWGDAWFHKRLEGGPLNGQDGQLVRLVLRVKLVADTIQGFLDMENFAEAWFWGDRTIGIIDRSNEDDHPIPYFPAPNVLGQIYYRTGVASKALDRLDDARSHFRVAYAYLPLDEDVRRALASVPQLMIEGPTIAES
jgi:hypothetical protein